MSLTGSIHGVCIVIKHKAIFANGPLCKSGLGDAPFAFNGCGAFKLDGSVVEKRTDSTQ